METDIHRVMLHRPHPTGRESSPPPSGRHSNATLASIHTPASVPLSRAPTGSSAATIQVGLSTGIELANPGVFKHLPVALKVCVLGGPFQLNQADR